MKNNPFKFLDAFTPDDTEFFFGRDREVEELYARVFQVRSLVVYGASGSGKTSLVQCGLATKFHDSDRLPVFVCRRAVRGYHQPVYPHTDDPRQAGLTFMVTQ